MINPADSEKPSPFPVIFIPGGIHPAATTYAMLLEVLQEAVQPILKDLELYASDAPPPDYRLELEIESIRHAGEAAGLKSFHLVEYSGGLSLAFTSKHPELVQSLALLEPGWIPEDGWRREEAEYWSEVQRNVALPAQERMRAMEQSNVRPGVRPPPSPPPGPPPPWMASRMAAGESRVRAYDAYTLDRESLRHFHRPVYLALGSLSPTIYERNANLLASLFPDLRIEVYEGRQHLDPPHRAEPARLARALRELWTRGAAASSAAA